MLDSQSEQQQNIGQTAIEPKQMHFKPISRRKLLELALKGSVVALASPFLPVPTSASAQQPNREFTIPPFEPKKEVIDGIDVYGTKEQINTQFQVKQHYDYFEKEFQKVAKQKGFAKAIPQEPIDYFDRIEAVLDPDKRYLQIVVARSLYETFKAEAKAGGIGFATWIKEHVEEMNRMIAELKPPTDLETIVKRILVVDDNFNPHNPNQTSMYKLPDNPWDIDGWDEGSFWTDPRKVSSFVGKISQNGKDIPIDYGLIHEWFHSLYAVMDEYSQDIERTMDIPDFFVMGDGQTRGILPELTTVRRTPWIAQCLRWFKENKVRGRYRSKKGGGNLGFVSNVNLGDLPGNALTIWAQRPNDVELQFLDSAGQKMEAEIEILTSRFPEATSETVRRGNLKTINGLRTLNLSNEGSFRLNKNDFIGKQFPDGTAFPTLNFIFKIKTKDGKSLTLHLPVSAFNMSAIAGKKDAKYIIEFSRDIQERENKVQMLEILNQSEISPQLLRDHPPDVKMKVDGTEDYFFWYLSENRPDRLRP